MNAFRQSANTLQLDATSAGAVMASAHNASHLLLSNIGTTWLQFSQLTTNVAPVDRTATGGYIPVKPGDQLVVAISGNAPYWGVFGGGKMLVTPGTAG